MDFPANIPPLPPSYFREDNSAPLLATCIFFLCIETIFIALMWTSQLITKDQKTNLWMRVLMTTGYVVCLSKITIGFLLVTRGGAGHHLLALTQEQQTTTLKLQTGLQIVCPLTTSLTKLSILCLLHNILGRTSTRAALSIKLIFALNVVILIVQFVIPFANCRPFKHNWEPLSPTGYCAIDSLALWRYLSIPNVVTTVMMIAIPLPALRRLRVSPTTKLGLVIVFSVCVMGIIAAIMRFVSFLEVRNFNDITFEMIAPLSWTVAESGIYLVAGILPTLRPLLRRISGKGGRFDKMISWSLSWTRGSKSGKSEESWELGEAGDGKSRKGKPLTTMPAVTTFRVSMDRWDDVETGSSRGDHKLGSASGQEDSVAILKHGQLPGTR